MRRMNAHAVAALPVRILRPLQPMTWLERAWHDVREAPAVGFGHGALMAAFGLLVMMVGRDRFWLMAGSLSGFLLVAPILATGLYAVSRALERGESADWSTVLAVWRSLDRRLVTFGLLLAAAGTCWVMTSAALITLLSSQPVLTPIDFLRHVVANRESWLFEIWLALGSLLAAPVFASSVIAIPMLVDRPIGVGDAVLASWRTVLENPVPMGVWAVLVMGFTLLGLASLMFGLVFVMPMLGHASWHAYRDLLPPEPAGVAR
jgi:uncharacterized membrane protein